MKWCEECKDYVVCALTDKKPKCFTDRKTSNCSEKSNNCETCRNKGFEGCEQPCLGCGCCDLYEPKTEPQTDEDCDYCKMTHKYWYEHCDICKRKPKDEPQTDCAWK